MKTIFEGWRRYLREAASALLESDSEKRMISGREAASQQINIVDFDPGAAREIAQRLADKLGAQLGKELGRGSMGIVYEMRGDEGEGADMILKISQFPHEKKGYTLTRWKKRQLAKNPELAAILPEVGDIVDTIYDFKEGWLKGRAIKIYGIPIERLAPLPSRVKEQLFGHGGKFKSPEAEKDWLQAITDPKLLIPVLRQAFSDKHTVDADGEIQELAPGEREYAWFDGGNQSGIEFEKQVLELEPPSSFRDYLTRWLPQIGRRAVRRAISDRRKDYGTPPSRLIQRQSVNLTKRLEDRIKIPQYPPEALKYFGIEGAYPQKGAPGPVADFFNKLMELEKYGVTFWDTHQDNIMMRPSTNEIVVSDVGLFRQPEEN
jgi:hypothetical protein